MLHIPPKTRAKTRALDNKLLASLPRDDFDLLAPHFTTVSLAQGVVLLEPDQEFDQVYFPHDGMLSLLAMMRDGKGIEIATLGRDGVFGAMAGWGLRISFVRAIVQLPMSMSKIPATPFRKAMESSIAIRDLSLNYNEVLLAQARITAACNALHPVEARFCRWLLQSADHAESDTVTLTQEFLSGMLGVRRTSVTEVASRVQDHGEIVYARGTIRIVDRPALERRSCECYRALTDQAAKLM